MTTTHPRPLLLAALLVASFAFVMTQSSCGDFALEQGANAQAPEGVVVCESDAFCADGQVCVFEWCVDPASTTMPIAVQLRFPGSTSDLRRQITGLLFEPGLAMPDLVEQTLVPVDVEVTRRTFSVSSRIRFRAERSIPGTSLEVWAQTSGEGGQLDLLPGSYNVTVFPSEGSGLPEREFPNVSVSEPPEGERAQVTLPLVKVDQGERLVVIEGFVLLQYDGVEVPAENVRLSAQSTDGLLSSPALETCSEAFPRCDGFFSITLPAQRLDETRRYQLVVEPSRLGQEIPALTLPEFVIGPDDLEAGVPVQDDSIRVDIGTFRATGIPAFSTLRGVVVSPGGEPAEGILVEARGAIDDTRYSTNAAEPTGPDGVFELQVAEEGTFDLTAIPPQQSPYASTTLRDLSSGAGLSLSLQRKKQILGTVFGRTDASPVADVVVTAVPLVTLDGEVAVDRSRQAETLTDAAGNYALALEEGSYELQLSPKATSGLPRISRRITVESEAPVQEEDIVLGETSVFFGQVLDASGEPASNVTLEIFAHDAVAGRAELIGQGTTDSRGVYRVIIPNPDSFEF